MPATRVNVSISSRLNKFITKFVSKPVKKLAGKENAGFKRRPKHGNPT
jgi:hypothetical protein